MLSQKPPHGPDPHAALAMMQQGRVRGRGRRSPVVIWMQENRAVLEQGLARAGPDWTKLAAYLGDHGVLDGDGQRPTPRAVRQAWYRTKAVAVTRAAAPPHIAPAQAAEWMGVAEPELPVTDVAFAVEDPSAVSRPSGERFKLATLRNHTPAASPPDPPPPMPAVPQQDAEAVIAAFLARGSRPGGGFRKPRPKDE